MSRVDLIVSLSQQLEDAVAAADQGKTLETLVSISELDMPPSLLRSSSIARVVGKQRKHPNSDVAALAGDVVSRWKQILTENPVRTISSNADSTLTDHDLSVDLHTSLLSSVSAVHIPGQHTDPALRCDQSRMRVIRGAPAAPGNVVYWMSRDQRIADNWALIKAQELAVANKAGLAIVFCLSSSFLGANLRHFGFMLRGLKELESKAAALNIQLHVLCGPPQDVLPTFIVDNNVSTVVCDFSPLRIAKQWKADVVTATASLRPAVQVVEVDAHNIAPCFRVSEKCEFSAKTIRTKIHNAVNIYLTEFPPVIVHPFLFSQVETEAASQQRSTSMWTAVAESVLPLLDTSVAEIDWMIPGEAAAWSHMRGFIPRLKSYGEQRNDPSVDNGVSHLSPYFHFGHLSVQRVLLEIKRTYNCGTGALFPSGERTTGIHSFCEEAVVRKELSDNFCNYNSKYDSIDGAHNWAQSTLREHWDDKRATLYSLEQLEGCATRDELWNAAQREMAVRGKMHGFMRMYWAKKILEWSPDPSEALRRAILLNDKYSIDGRDPNGYVGCMWAIAGVHDRAWGRRPVFGTIRYMNYDGCKRKFDILKYIRKCGPATSKTSETTQKSVNSFFARNNVGASIVEDDSNPKKKARKS